MTTSRKILWAGLLAATALSGCDVVGQRHRSDADLIRTFTEHRTQFEEIVAMTSQDDKLRRVDDTWTDPADPAEAGVSAERIAQYREKMSAIGVARGFATYGGPGYVELYASAQGLVTGGSSKGYLHTTRPPAPLVEDLDAAAKAAGPSILPPVYRRIDQDWYLFYEQN
jgi:hypothetical protein